MAFLCFHYLINALTRIVLGSIDHSLAILKNTSGPEEEKRKKKNEKLLQGKDIDIIVQCTF